MSAHVRPVVSRRDLIAVLERDQFALDETVDSSDAAYRHGWNARAKELIAWLDQGNVEAGLDELVANAPISDVEAEQILAIEKHEQSIAADRERRERARTMGFWAFEFDIEQDAIERVYEGEGG